LKAKQKRRVLVFKLIPLLLVSALSLSAAINVPFQVSNWATIQRSGEPVTAGLPLPAATVYDLSKLRVVDGAGNTVPAQFRPLTKWWYEISSTIPNERKASPSVKWVLMDFQADVPAKNRASFTLKDDNSGSTPSTQLSVTEASDQVTVSTGPLTFKVSKQHFNLFDEVTINGQQIITSNPLNGGFITSVASSSQGLAGGIVHTTARMGADAQVMPIAYANVVAGYPLWAVMSWGNDGPGEIGKAERLTSAEARIRCMNILSHY
jgi:hypothetical protein